ncbi:MAG: bifunctional 5,10-methylene-tetrahydrofolate dehydrogenase/5,10-methylene-tetrahydrofolate cyclohydrolase [Thermoplasmatales archaeon B_DKE]|nr:MAG: bifunctional 5,10-methylene-tetrahydrofolate dehydrogenase/5,10-methylene-tetrahydrofolate cyclohydrolase [Thermoplasmatales archaeon B_DKE]
MTVILNGTPIAESIIKALKGRVEALKSHGVEPHLFLIQVGRNEAIETYVRAKIRRGAKIGIKVSHKILDENITYEALNKEIANISGMSDVNGVMIENPLPKHLDFFKAVESIPFYKDVDGMTPTNQGMIALKNEFLTPATAAAVTKILTELHLPGGTTATIINRSPIVGKPLAMMLLNRDFTVTVCHSKTGDIRSISRNSQVLVTAVGTPNFIDRSYVTEDSIVVDVGINPVDGGIRGDANYEELFGYVRAITPVPGGVGPITATQIMENTVKATEYQNSFNKK